MTPSPDHPRPDDAGPTGTWRNLAGVHGASPTYWPALRHYFIEEIVPHRSAW